MSPQQQTLKSEYELFAEEHKLEISSFTSLSPTFAMMFVSGKEAMALTNEWLEGKIKFYYAIRYDNIVGYNLCW